MRFLPLPYMPRRPRAILPDVAHHITQRGNNREPVFHSSDDRRFYLDLLGRHAAHYGARILGYCLMTNHVHLIAVPRLENSLARTLGCTHSEYALALNRAQGRSGHVWQNRFFSCLLDESHLLRALRYVELNPVRAGLASDPSGWPWSSARAHTVDGVLDPVLDCCWAEYFGRWDFGEWREILSAGISVGESDSIRRATHTGEPLGSRDFVAAVERQAGRRLRVLARGRPRKEPEAAGHIGIQDSLFAGSG
jgi:putative transposase